MKEGTTNMMENWVEMHGTPELKRALAEGYEVKKGVANLLIENLADESDMKLHLQSDWLEVQERTSPRAESFEARDRVSDLVRDLEKPEGWHIDVSRISRFALLDGSYFTGVLLDVRDETRRQLTQAALNFEW